MSEASPENRAAGEVVGLTEWALRLGYQAGRVLDHPAAYLIPAEVKDLVRELAALVKRLAFEVETLKGGGDGKA